MNGSFEVPLRHLAFDDTREAAGTSWWIDTLDDLFDDAFAPSFVFSGGKRPPGR